jgi:Transposase DDE domain
MRVTGSGRAGSGERRLEPQITIGLLTGADGFPLMVSAFEGNKAETKTMLPVIESFMAAHQLPDVTVVADAGMVSEANQKQIEAAGLSFILGAKIPHVPYLVAQWHQTGWSIRKFVKTARRYRTVQIQAGDHVITAADPLPGDLRQAVETINGSSR